MFVSFRTKRKIFYYQWLIRPLSSFGVTCWRLLQEPQYIDTLLDKVKIIKTMLFRGHYRLFLNEVRRRLYLDEFSYGLRRDLTIPFNNSEANISLSVRQLNERDITKLLNIDESGITSKEFKERAIRLSMLKANIQTCYVAVTSENNPCNMLWLIESSENEKVQEYFKGGFPVLSQDEILIEGVFTHEAYRNQGIMNYSVTQIAKRGVSLGARWAISFVRHSNIPSLKGFKRANFTPYIIRRDRWRLFRRQSTFISLSDEYIKTKYEGQYWHVLPKKMARFWSKNYKN